LAALSGLHACGVSTSVADLAQIVEAYDKFGHGRIRVDDVLRALLPHHNEGTIVLLHKIFASLAPKCALCVDELNMKLVAPIPEEALLAYSSDGLLDQSAFVQVCDPSSLVLI
jgi:hypothetical protein